MYQQASNFQHLSLIVISSLIFSISCSSKSPAEAKSTSDIQWTGKGIEIQIEWITVSNGTFTYGSPETFPCRGGYDEEEVEVTLTNNFEMAATEVTQEQWQALELPLPLPIDPNPDTPMSFVSFYDAALWCNRLSIVEGLDTCYDLSNCSGEVGVWCETSAIPPGDGCGEATENFSCPNDIHKFKALYDCPGYRLPTTAEWEYAAKAGTTGHTYNGDVHAVPVSYCEEEPALEEIAWYCDNADDKLHPVKQKLPNPWGLYDILGNAAEWVDYANHGVPIDVAEGKEGSVLVNPSGRSFGDYYALKGGFFYLLSGCYLRPSYHMYEHPYFRGKWTGFRPVRTLFDDEADSDSQK